MKNPFPQLVQIIFKELKLGSIPKKLHKTLEGQINEIIDHNIEQSLAQTLDDEDWKFFEENLEKGEKPDQAFNTMLTRRPEIQTSVENAIAEACDEILISSEEVRVQMQK